MPLFYANSIFERFPLKSASRLYIPATGLKGRNHQRRTLGVIVESEEFKAYFWDKVGKWNGNIRNLKKSKDTSQKNHSSKPEGV